MGKKEVLLIIAILLSLSLAYAFFVPIDIDIDLDLNTVSVVSDDFGFLTYTYQSGGYIVIEGGNPELSQAALSGNLETFFSAAFSTAVISNQPFSFSSADGSSYATATATDAGLVLDIVDVNGDTFKGTGIVNLGPPKSDGSGGTFRTGEIIGEDGSVTPISVVQPKSGEGYIILAPIEPPPPPTPPDSIIFPSGPSNPFPTFYPVITPLQAQSNFCGNGLLVFPEQCEAPNTYSNSYCGNVSKVCGNFSITKDKLGRCNGNCQCVYDCKCLSKDELCNGIDDDCNGRVDDINVNTCAGQEALCPNQLGVCKNSQKTCAGAAGYMPCISKNYNSTGKYETAETKCDNLDNDCDGSIDEGCDCLPGSTNPCGYSFRGACRLGAQTCSADGTWETCINSIVPSSFSETACDSIDNDCDGKVDECTVNACGECGILPDEVCNYRDDNCNSEPGSPTAAVFNQAGKFYELFSDYCIPGTTCKGVYADGIDNNGNGLIDEGIDEDVKEKPNEPYTSWCQGCQTQFRRCSMYQEAKFKQTHSEFYYNNKLSLKDAIERQIVANTSGTFYFACQPNELDISCCLENQCVYNGRCYDKGHKEDIDNDGVVEVCFSQSPGVWHEFGEIICEADCTYFDDSIVHASCDGQNGCSFYDSIARAACDNSQPGWVRDYNSTHYVVCASGSPQPKIEIAASVSCESGTLVKVTRIVVYNGKPVKLVVAACG